VRRTILCIGALVVPLTAGCGDDDDTASTGTTVTTDTATSIPGATTSSTAAATTTSVVAADPLLIVLNPDGLGFTTANSGSINRLDFGSDQQLTRDTVVKALGAPVEEAPQPECPPGPADQSRFDEITLTFQDGTFVGWSAGRGSPLTTGDGIGVGSTLAELRDAFADVEFVDSTLGVEVIAGDYDMILSDETDEGQVDSMLAGVNCVFR
jgi:hypothetical protein